MKKNLNQFCLSALVLSLSACNSGANNNTETSTNATNTANNANQAIAINSKGSIKIMTTGQKAVYAPNDDGELQPGGELNETRFVQGTGSEKDCIIDTTTGFMWPKNGKPFESAASWNDGLDSVNAMNKTKGAPSYNLCGHNDWRMPNTNELETLINYGTTSNADWLESFGFTNIERSKSYYTSTSMNADGACPQDSVFATNLNTGYSGKKAKVIDPKPYAAWLNPYLLYTMPVRTANPNAAFQVAKTGQMKIIVPYNPVLCKGNYTSPTGSDGDLRLGKAWPSIRFSYFDDNGQCVKDNLTGLVWLADGGINSTFIQNTYAAMGQPGARNGISWENAMNMGIPLMNKNKVCGKSNWRIPAVREIHTLANYNVIDNTQWLNSQGFVNIHGGPSEYDWYLTSTSNSLDNQYAAREFWSVSLSGIITGQENRNVQSAAHKATSRLSALLVSGGTTVKPETKIKPDLTQKTLFITQTGYTKFAGISSADAICNNEAAMTGSLINKKATFKALLIANNRYPCASNGKCGIGAANNWPVTPLTKYVTVGNGASLSSNEFGVFENNFSSGQIRDQFGYRQDKYFWLGINGILNGTVNSNLGQIVGWSYANLDGIWTPKNIGGLWSNYTDTTAANWTFPSSITRAGVGDNGLKPDNYYRGTSTTSAISLKLGVGYSINDAIMQAGVGMGLKSLTRWVNDEQAWTSTGGYATANQIHLLCIQQ